MPPGEPRTVEVEDERTELAHAAIDLIHTAIRDVQPADDLLSEIEERRRGLPSGGDYHLIASVDGHGVPVAAAAGVFLESVNAGFVNYLAVREEVRGQRHGGELRARLVDCFRDDARRAHGGEPAWTVGEVRRESAWLRTLVRGGRAIPFDFGYFHPWMPLRAEGRYILYREPIADGRGEVSGNEVARLLFAIWRRAYRIRYPLQSETFCYMLRQLDGRETIGADPAFAED